MFLIEILSIKINWSLIEILSNFAYAFKYYDIKKNLKFFYFLFLLVKLDFMVWILFLTKSLNIYI